MPDTYWIKLPGETDYRQVSKKDFVELERACGFHNTMGRPLEPATGGFSSPWGQGQVRYEKTGE